MSCELGRIGWWEVVVRVRRWERDGGKSLAMCSRSSVVVICDGIENEVVGGRESPGKVLRRTLIL